MDLAVKRVGGFGRYQFLCTVIMALFRNAGLSIIYGVPTLVAQQDYLCRTVPDAPLEACETDNICALLAKGDFVEYEVDKTAIGYLQAWEEEMNLMCVPRSQVSFMTSCYFIGFGVGIILFPLPDLYGRRKALLVSMAGYLVAITMLLFFKSMTMRSISLFLIGFFHLKNSSSYVLCYETVQDKHKALSSTAINAFDGATLIFLGTYFIFVKDWFPYQFIMFIIQFISFFVFLALMTESPKWLLLKGRNLEAIEVFNYYARFNGYDESRYIPQDAVFVESYANLSKAVALKKDGDKSKTKGGYGKTMKNLTRQLSDTSFTQATEEQPAETKGGYCTQLHMLCLFFFIFQMGYICYYLLGILKGSKTTLNIVTGLGESSGMIVTGILLSNFKDKNIVFILIILNAIMMSLIYFIGQTNPIVNYISLFFCINTVAGAFNVSFVMAELRTPPQILGAFIEISVSVGTMSCLVVHFILQQGLPFTVTTNCCMAIPLLLLLVTLPKPLKEEIFEEEQELQ